MLIKIFSPADVPQTGPMHLNLRKKLLPEYEATA